MARPRARARWLAVAGLASACTILASTAIPAGATEPVQPAARRVSAVFVELDRASALQRYLTVLGQGADAARSAAKAARSAIADATDELLAGFRGTEAAATIFRTSNAVPGFAVRADPALMGELARRPGVRSVRRITPARTSNASADQLGRALAAWQQTGRLGAGVRIGVIDTGVDYTHADFGGPGTGEAFTSPHRSFPTDKVIGGIDLAGDDYDADSSDPAHTVPVPDADPIDCQGHGSHVAGTAAGLGVAADGTTFRGDPRTLTADQLNGMRIGPGAAPGASLYAIRVFGCSGATALTAEGLDHALDPNGDGDFDDKLDVVNLSLGTSFGAVDDPVNDFVQVLTDNGILVVAAAGNSGDLYDAGGSPGNSPYALAVASVRDAGVLLDGAEVPGEGAFAGQYSVQYERYDELDLTAPVVELGGPDAQGCTPYGPTEAAKVRAVIVWLAWDDEENGRECGSGPRADNASAAGAVGVVLTSALPDFGSTGIAGNTDIPVFQLTGPSTAALRPLLAASGLRMRFAGALAESQQIRIPKIEDTPSAFSSRGVRGPTAKPDVAAPGESITSVESGSGNGRAKLSGTSMASPFAAGVAALVLEEHPDWTPAQVKAAIMGTATADVFSGNDHTGTRMGPMRVGAGRIDARAALATSVLAANAEAPDAVSVSFGTVEVPPGQPLISTQQIRVSNTGEGPVALGAAYEPLTTTPGVRIDVSPAGLTVPPGEEALLDVTMRIDEPAALRHTADPTLTLVQDGRARQYLSDASGRVVLTPRDGGHGPLRVPVSVSPKPVSTLATTYTGGQLRLTGTAVDQGTGREAYRSRVGVFALTAESPELPVCAGPDAVRGCVANDTGRGGDLRNVGAASTVAAARAAGRPENALLAFAVTMWADLYNVGTRTLPTVEIDTNGDDTPDYTTELTTLPGTDVLVARTTDDAADSKEVDVQPVNGFDGDTSSNVFDTDTWVLPVRLAALGIDPNAASAPVRFRVVVRGEYGPPGTEDGFVDATETISTFDPLAPAVAVTTSSPDILLPADDGTTLTTTGSAEAPLLVVLGQNGTGSRVATFGSPPAAEDTRSWPDPTTTEPPSADGRERAAGGR